MADVSLSNRVPVRLHRGAPKASQRLVLEGDPKASDKALDKDKNFLGICLGMQLLFKESSEFVKTKSSTIVRQVLFTDQSLKQGF